ncbi:FAD-binding oxidoreductase [Nguyenibacter vanlangensis]|uniref:FAD-binding oxidoreductase n=1 Tax=Nguyenibacter vanlangensis TaxID=1216886 RepID=A0ABZ3CZU1_9PROT
MTKSALVLGGGMVGVCTAWHLAQRGFDVTLIERGEPGRETSYGNAGLIQREAVEPYEFPHDLGTLLRVAVGIGNDVAWRARDLPAIAPRLLRYWWHSFPSRYRAIARSYEAMIRHCLDEHQRMIAAAGADNLVARNGWKALYRTGRAFEVGIGEARDRAQRTGILSEILDGAALARAEPVLLHPMAGAIHWRDPWSVSDPGELVGRYAALLEAAGGRILRGDARSLTRHAGGWRVETAQGPVDAAQAVIALGPWSDMVARTLGYRLPLFVKRGYHRHFAWPGGLATPVLDTEMGIAMIPMARGLRVTTGAEFAHRDAPSGTRQMARSEQIARALLPLGAAVEAQPWRGARPCMPDMLPVIGPAWDHPGLWFHFGHAHQGFTLGPTTGRLCAEMMNGETPFIDPAPYSPARFRRA